MPFHHQQHSIPNVCWGLSAPSPYTSNVHTASLWNKSPLAVADYLFTWSPSVGSHQQSAKSFQLGMLTARQRGKQIFRDTDWKLLFYLSQRVFFCFFFFKGKVINYTGNIKLSSLTPPFPPPLNTDFFNKSTFAYTQVICNFRPSTTSQSPLKITQQMRP